MLKALKILLLIVMMSLTENNLSADNNKVAYDFSFKNIDGTNLSLSNYKGKVLIVVNVASKCGFTSQYEDMQNIWETYRAKGVVILGVPSNDFGGQEPGTNEDIKNFCETNFGINFPMTEKVSVKGSDAHAFYKWAKESHGKSAVPKWNFHKIVIGKKGKVYDTFASITKPSSKRFISSLEKALDKI